MWNSFSTPQCPCVREDIPVIRIKIPGLEEDFEKLDKAENEYTETAPPATEKAEPLSETFVGPYTPMPYTFRLGCGPPCPGQQARSPPLWLLIDHSLAVIWSLFSTKKTLALGVGQLQWALTFLKSIKDENDMYSPDVQICIDALENRLCSEFAGTKYVDGKQIPCRLSICEPCHPPPSAEKENGKGKEPLTTIKEETSKTNISSSPQPKATCPIATKEKPVPISVTINSMLKSHSTSVLQLFKAGSATINKQSDEAFSLPK